MDWVFKCNRPSMASLGISRIGGQRDLTVSVDTDGPCEYCRSINEACTVDLSKRRQKPFYFVSEEEYRLLHEVCSNVFPGQELTVPNLRRLASEQRKTASLIGASTSESTGFDAAAAVSEDAGSASDVPSTQQRNSDVPLPEIVNLYQEMGCLLADGQGEYRNQSVPQPPSPLAASSVLTYSRLYWARIRC